MVGEATVQKITFITFFTAHICYKKTDYILVCLHVVSVFHKNLKLYTATL